MRSRATSRVAYGREKVGPQAAITWSQGVSSSVKTDVNVKTLVGKGSGETFQLAFSGSGWLLLQPSEGSAGTPAGGAIGSLLGGR